MRRTFLLLLIGIFCSVSTIVAAEEKNFGPTKYEIKERYGRKNQYSETVKAPAEGDYVVKLQNGEKSAERPDLIAFSVNGKAIVKEANYSYGYLACFLSLKKENAFELAIRDYTPTGFKRPPATPRNAVVEILAAPVKLSGIVLGLNAWEDLGKYTAALFKIKSPDAFSLALSAANLQNSSTDRAAAMRQIADRKDPTAQDFIFHLFRDTMNNPNVRAEAAVALGLLNDKAMIPALIDGALDPDELIRIGSARALSFYKEADTNELLAKALKGLDSYMRSAVVKTIVSAGWKPVNLSMEFSESTDPAIANMGIELMAGSQDKRIVDRLLQYLDKPGVRDVRFVILALGESKDPRAVDALSRIARDPEKRRGKEAELGTALAALGDPKSADLIVDMLKKAETAQTYRKLSEAYKRLTGLDYNKKK